MKLLSRLLNTLIVLCAWMTAPSFGWAADGTSAARLAKDAVCTRCHDESESKPILSIYQTRHGVTADAATPSCQGCHGESKNHLGGNIDGKGRPKPDVVFGAKKTTAGYTPNEPQEQSEACLACHKDGKRTHWAGSQHESHDMTCANCHSLHKPQDPLLSKATQPEVCFGCHKTQRAQTHRISTHPLDAGKMACSDCHNPHGSTGPKLLVKNSVNETCYTCHAEKRGPFLWEHSPVTDDCTNCHTPHGSTNTPLLKTRVPWLCQECHSGDHGAQVNSGANLQNGNVTTNNGITPLASAAARAQMGGRACLNCHVLVHGSNHPAGSKFQR
jgi:DmsE family decaheme c-type cytochrome